MALAILVLIVALITEIIVLQWGLIESSLLFRSLREKAALSSINKFELAKRFQTQALTFSFYKTYDLLGERGGYYQFSPTVRSTACIPYWKIYDEKFVPNIKKEMGDTIVKIFNKYMQFKIDENLQLPSYEKIEVTGGEIKERKWCEEKTCSADWGTSCRVGGICIEKGEEDPVCTYTVCRWGLCVGACPPYLGVCSETRVCKATCKENLEKCPSTIPNFQATTVTSNNLVFEREKIKIEESGIFSQNITAGLLYEHYFGNQTFVENEKIKEAIRDAINDVINEKNLKSSGLFRGCISGDCPSDEEIFYQTNGITTTDVETLIKSKIREKLENLENELSIPQKREIDIESEVKSKVVLECSDCVSEGCGCPTCCSEVCSEDPKTGKIICVCPCNDLCLKKKTCNFYYFGAVNASITITNLENKFLIGNELKPTPLKFRIIEEYGTKPGYINLFPYPSTEDCPPPI
jgi:hypothetical protein